MAVNKKKREKEKGKRKRKDSPRVVGMSVRFEHCSNAWKVYIACPNSVQTVFEQHVKQCVMFEHCSKCSNIAKQGQIVRTVFEQHTTTRRAVQTLFERMDREYNMSKHCPNSVRTAREAVCDV